MSLTIRAFSVGRVFGLPKPSFTYLRGWGDTMDLPLIMFVIEGGDAPVVVDTGADLSRAWDTHRIKMEQTVEERPEVALRSAGIDPDDVRLVVNTHLHWDHSSNNHLFPNARVVVQQRELDFARQPVPWHCRQFEALPDMDPAWQRAEDKIVPVDGDTELAPGITLVALPGTRQARRAFSSRQTPPATSSPATASTCTTTGRRRRSRPHSRRTLHRSRRLSRESAEDRSP